MKNAEANGDQGSPLGALRGAGQGNLRERMVFLPRGQCGSANRGVLLTMGAVVVAAAVIVGIYIARDHSIAQGDETEAAAQQLSQADRDKLAALEQAYKAGVLTKEEYEARRKQFLGAAGAPSNPRSGGSSSLWLKLARVMDNGFGEQIEVVRLLIPSDWRFEGGTHWNMNNANCPTNLVTTGFRATSPDGRFALELLPAYTWTWYDDPMNRQNAAQTARAYGGCDLNPPLSAADFIQRMVVPKVRPGSRSVGVQPVPELARALERVYGAQMNVMMQTKAIRGVRFDAARVKLQETEGGETSEEWITGAVSSYAAPVASLSAAQNGQMGQTNFYAMEGQSIIAARAPQGQLDSAGPLFATMLITMRFNERWAAAYADLVRKMQNEQLRGTVQRAQIWHQAMEQTNEIYRQSYESHQQVQDRLAEQFSQMIRGTETYTDPNTHESIELPEGYNAWRSNAGTYFLTYGSENPNSIDREHHDWTLQQHKPAQQ